MVKEKNRYARKGAALLAVALAAVIPFAAMAETATQETASADTTSSATVRATMPGRASHGFAYSGSSLDTSSLTEEQQAAYASAVQLYEQVEDSVLADLISAGVIAQADADSYIALRTAKKTLTALDMTGWTAEQYKAYYEANAKTGDARKEAMQALVTAGQLTQEQGDALGAQGQSSLWATVQKNASTNSAIQTALATMQQAQRTLNSTLRDAGITGTGKGVMFDGFGPGSKNMGQGTDRNSNTGKPQNGNGSRK